MFSFSCKVPSAPITNTEFHRSKSKFSVKEFHLGVGWLVSCYSLINLFFVFARGNRHLACDFPCLITIGSNSWFSRLVDSRPLQLSYFNVSSAVICRSKSHHTDILTAGFFTHSTFITHKQHHP